MNHAKRPPVRDRLALLLEALGVLAISAGAALYSHALGLVTLGIGGVLFGVALERSD